ncbi:hypothetical protein [Jatrophihabitans sp. GAS493]|uniref:hypothetical protein n=1 Tax=Jatrophihabitans sp. GAS493 TaxID=1907575 RepID=UPI000BB941A8|nr:hypothetical protein [Jatrophihabitans sp. GAS493]
MTQLAGLNEGPLTDAADGDGGHFSATLETVVYEPPTTGVHAVEFAPGTTVIVAYRAKILPAPAGTTTVTLGVSNARTVP